MVEGEEEKSWWKDKTGEEETISGYNGPGERCDTDVKNAWGEGFVWGNDGFDTI